MAQADVPQGRNGKHKAIVTKILSDLDQIQKGVALKVPLAQLAASKENVRSALNRATRKAGATSRPPAKVLSLCVERNAVEDDRCAIERSADAVEGTVTKSVVPTKHPVRLYFGPQSVVTNHASVGFSSVPSGNLGFAIADPRDACLSTRV